MTDLFSKALVDGATVQIAPGQYKPEQLRGFAEKIDGKWYAVAFIDHSEARVVIAISQGKKYKRVLEDAMSKAIERITSGTSEQVQA